jgi:demethoxyubiquinone hydroxylase (CLK1/Coq7/Cat5 family)
MKKDKIQEAMAHSQHAVRVLSQLAQGSQELQEAVGLLKRAVQKMEHQATKGARRHAASQTAAQQWWGEVTAGAIKASEGSHSKLAEVAAARTLKELDKMLSAEQKKLNELENKVKEQQQKPTVAEDDAPSSQVFFD